MTYGDKRMAELMACMTDAPKLTPAQERAARMAEQEAEEQERVMALRTYGAKIAAGVRRSYATNLGPRPTRPGQIGRKELQGMTPEEVLAAHESGKLNEIMGK